MIYISFDIGIKNLAVCILKKTDKLSILDWRIISLAETKKEIKGIEDISERIYIELDNIIGYLKEKGINTIDYVLIENQPSNLNGLMKTIQYIIYCYFSLLKYWDKIVDNVVLVNASLKTKTHDFKPEIQVKMEDAQKAKTGKTAKNSKGFRSDKYKMNKQTSIEICKHYIKDDANLCDIFDNNKKKDDLCDACLQAVSYIRLNDDGTNKGNFDKLTYMIPPYYYFSSSVINTMFARTINNPNNLIVDDYGDEISVIPFGHRCTSALACKYSNIRKYSLPFDWVMPLFPSKIKKILENNFDGFIPDVRNEVFTNKYDITFHHFNSDVEKGIDEHNRRIERFTKIINEQKKIYFVYINEDYLYDEEYRKDDLNNNAFNEMLELEKYLKSKYINIDYTILYLDFKHHEIPADSNILNVVLSSTKVYNNRNVSPYEDFRNYCGKILSELFNTTLTLDGYNSSIFNDE